MTFKAEDVTVMVVSDGNQALSRAKESKPDLILADINMPGVGGYELCERVRADAGMRHIPVLLLGGGTPVDPARAIAVGANGHMPKPFDSQKLVEQVKQILANPKAVAVAPAAAGAAASAMSPLASPGGTAAPRTSAPPPSRPGGPASRPPVPVSRPPQPAGVPGSTLTMPRPATVPGMRPGAGPPPGLLPGPSTGAPRPAGAAPPRPPG